MSNKPHCHPRLKGTIKYLIEDSQMLSIVLYDSHFFNFV